jgi:multisubunit Na+/H+ antiporter MnhG subunit
LSAAVFMRAGNTSASWKTVFIGAVLIAINSVVTHATARAFRTRELGHWRPRQGDNVEWVTPERSDA